MRPGDLAVIVQACPMSTGRFDMADPFDVIVVGARCAGSPTAMLLAQQGYRVLVVDRSTFPSDTVSTHLIHPPGVDALRRWGLLDTVIATGCPPVDTYSFDFGPITISGTPLPAGGSSTAYAPRRTVLDTILVDAANAAGAEVREGFTVDEVVVDDGKVVGIRGRDRDGRSVTERARVVIGADGSSSRVAAAVGPEQYHDKPILQAGFYTYFSDLPVNGFEITIRPERGWAALPTNDDLTLVVVGWPYAEHTANKHDVEGNFLRSLDLSPAFAERVRAATRVDRFHGSPVPNFFRKPYGPGWGLVGDAGYTKDPITAQGISNAFRDADGCAAALHATFAGDQPFDEAMSGYQAERDAHAMPMYEFTTQLATLEPAPPDMQELLGAIHGNQPAMDAFVSITAGTLSPPDFFDPANLSRLLGAPAGTP
jgi:2-polyprenyl-6-methoxyphenol hydroxylase-like FAD-dependent oxidoreductase